jgi:uncharacterized protein with FMN-binding domain
MRRILLGLMGAAVGTALMVGYKAMGAQATGPVATTGTQNHAGNAAAGTGPSGVPGQTGQPGPNTPGVSAAPGMTTGPGANPSAHPTTSGTTPPPKTTTTTTAPPQSRTITGNAVAASTAKSPTCGECSGNMQVRITVTGTHIDSITTIQQSNRPLSTASTLTAQALSAQSANVGNISGATYSSLAWKQSLQSAISQI